ncbi:hypothetical protein DY240_03460 [Jiangella rhizosphaerae]|uniref:Helix-hairpin-helix domain-containing protein n=1 Tax=Jiangella rhizosphaerae TaxID=2293569 RepID=A0A418KVH1_9ACTN|nr:hypothetical protein DY240_03460 [Jiangella rhizosphaerae]
MQKQSAGRAVARVIGHGLWILIPILSLSILSWLPATQAWWRSRSAGWAITAVVLALACAGIVVGMVGDADGAGWGLLLIGTMVGGVVAAALGRSVVFGSRPAVQPRPAAAPAPPTSAHRIAADPAVQAVLERRERRTRAREIATHDLPMAYELAIGRPDLPRTFDDGGLVDLNNTSADGLATALGWPRETAEAFVVARDLRGGYASWDELGALSGLETPLVERDAERLILLPHRPA